MSPPRDGPVVLKFGGTSVATASRMRAAALRVQHFVSMGSLPLVVVSAPGGMTDEILGWIGGIAPGLVRRGRPGSNPSVPGDLHGAPAPSHRESDRALATGEDLAASLLALALSSTGVEARSLRGREAGLHASGPFGAGVVTGVDPGPVRDLLQAGLVPVVSGFQAQSPDGETLTLGRGGSDWTAVLLASTLGASECHIVTDVPAIFDRDPREAPGARPYRRISHERLGELVQAGSRVVHPDAARLALRDRVTLRVYGYWNSPALPGGTEVADGADAEWGEQPGEWLDREPIPGPTEGAA